MRECASCHAKTTLCNSTFGGTAAYHSLDTMLGHKIHSALRTALDGLPALHRTPQGAGDKGQFLEGVATVGYLGRQRIVFALM